MSEAPFPDTSKAPVCVMTMVYQDYFFLKKWYQYYSAQFDPAHLYIFSHGNDPEHRKIAPKANVIGVYRDPTLRRLERKRWNSMSELHKMLLTYYNWVICSDVDELILFDPEVSTDLGSYLAEINQDETPPKSICPLGIEIIHNPELEPDEIDENQPILDQRRVFRLNANYSKPCILREPGRFSVGGHANTHLPRVLADHLFLVHLRFFDYKRSHERLVSRLNMRKKLDRSDNEADLTGAWSNDLENLKTLSSRVPEQETIDFPEFRKKMVDGMRVMHSGTMAFWGGGRTHEVYRLPERFSRVF
ncbi:MAG: glycosyltransferase family 2 protein [Pseudomonadota bacterium]